MRFYFTAVNTEPHKHILHRSVSEENHVGVTGVPLRQSATSCMIKAPTSPSKLVPTFPTRHRGLRNVLSITVFINNQHSAAAAADDHDDDNAPHRKHDQRSTTCDLTTLQSCNRAQFVRRSLSQITSSPRCCKIMSSFVIIYCANLHDRLWNTAG